MLNVETAGHFEKHNILTANDQSLEVDFNDIYKKAIDKSIVNNNNISKEMCLKEQKEKKRA